MINYPHSMRCRTSASQTAAAGVAPGATVPPSLPPPLQDCNAAAGSADYETLQVPATNACLLGARFSQTRRKRDAACFNTASYQPALTQAGLCNCTAADAGGYVCVWGCNC